MATETASDPETTGTRDYPGSTPYAGPVAYLFYTEMLAKYLYPDRFGEFRGIGNTPGSEQLFDRQKVADIVNGDL